jgi:hypothetical protein
LETCFLAGTSSTLSRVTRDLRLISISSPALISFDDLALIPLTLIRPASQNSCASVRRGIKRLAFKNKSRRIKVKRQKVKGKR